jgi:hypothetical protein
MTIASILLPSNALTPISLKIDSDSKTIFFRDRKFRNESSPRISTVRGIISLEMSESAKGENPTLTIEQLGEKSSSGTDDP